MRLVELILLEIIRQYGQRFRLWFAQRERISPTQLAIASQVIPHAASSRKNCGKRKTKLRYNLNKQLY